MNQDYLEAEEKLKGHWQLSTYDSELPPRTPAETLIDKDWLDYALPVLRARANEQGVQARDYYVNLLRSHDTIESLFEALHQTGEYEKDYRRPLYVWAHQPLEPLRYDDATRGFEINKEYLLRAAANYLSHPEIRTGMLDWQFLDSIVFHELNAFAAQVILFNGRVNFAAHLANRNLAKYYLLRLVFSLMGFAIGYIAIPGLAIYLLANSHEIVGGIIAGFWALNLLIKIIGFPFRWRTRKKAKALLQHLIDVYGLLGNQTISPRLLKETIDRAVAAGVVLDGSVFTIVDRLMSQDKTAFIPSSITAQIC